MTKTQEAALVSLLAELTGKTRKPKARKASPKPAEVVTPEDRFAHNSDAVRRVFAKNGIENVNPGVDVLVYKAWLAKGFKVRSGEKATRVRTKFWRGKGMPLFHVSQVEPVTEQVAS